jgi:uncharacterized protein YjbJ (UPF0337 family)
VRSFAASLPPGSEQLFSKRKEQFMDDGTLDDAKGRVKQAAGDITDDDSLKNEGKVDRASGAVKDKVGGVADAVKDVVNPSDDK